MLHKYLVRVIHRESGRYRCVVYRADAHSAQDAVTQVTRSVNSTDYVGQVTPDMTYEGGSAYELREGETIVNWRF